MEKFISGQTAILSQAAWPDEYGGEIKGCSSLSTLAGFLTIPASYVKLQLHCQNQQFPSSDLKAGGVLSSPVSVSQFIYS